MQSPIQNMRSQLTNARLSDINSGNWVADYSYYKNGDMVSRTVQANQTDFTYSGNQMITAGGSNLDYDENGQLITGASGQSLVYNWDGKLRSATKGDTTINLKYDPMGNRIWRKSGSTARKYIVDIVACPERSRGSDLPVTLLELDPNSSMEIKKTYIYANSQVFAEHNGSHSAPRYFYLHDRLGSVRQVIDSNAVIVMMFTFNPFGETIENYGSFYTPWQFTGQYLDSETGQYYLRARQYDSYIARFTSRDIIDGRFAEPLTLHKYLYCGNDPINYVDPEGLWTIHVMLSGMLSAGFSLMGQAGIVYDGENWGWIVTSNDPHPIEGFEGDWGLGVGIPAASAGIAVGWTNADTILDLEGEGISIGGSITLWGPFGVGVDYIRGIQRSGEYYHGFEFVPQVSTPGWEVHGHATWTTVIPWESNQQEGLDIMQESIEDFIYNAQTVGQSYMLLTAWGMLQ